MFAILYSLSSQSGHTVNYYYAFIYYISFLFSHCNLFIIIAINAFIETFTFVMQSNMLE